MEIHKVVKIRCVYVMDTMCYENNSNRDGKNDVKSDAVRFIKVSSKAMINHLSVY